MRSLILLLICLNSWTFCFSQTENEKENNLIMDPAAIEFRTKMTIPPYGLEKVKAMIAKLSAVADKDETHISVMALSAADFNNLSLREKFTYTMIHAEVDAQNCDIPENQKAIDKKIFGKLLGGFDEADWSERQIDFLKENRDSVMKLIRESVLRSKRMGVNYKETIEQINGWQMIPFIIEYAKKTPKDKDALTLLLLLMKRGEYSEFMKSTSFKKLYGDTSNYYSYLDYNKENEALIYRRAMGYYNEKKGK